MPYDPYPVQTPGQQVLEGLRSFSDSVNKLSMQHSLQQAQDQIDNISSTAKNDFEMHQQYRQVGQQLAFQLAAAGADASKINSVVSAIPQAAPPPQNALEALASENPRMQEIGKNYLSETEGSKSAIASAKNATEIEKALIAERSKQAAATAKQSNKEDAAFQALPDTFAKQKDIEPLLTAQNSATQAQSLLAQGDTVNAANQLVKIGILKSGGLNRITQQEIASVTGNPDWKSGLSRMLSLASQGTLPEADRANFAKVLDAIRSSSQSSLESKINDIAESKAAAGTGRYSYDQYRSVMRKRAGFHDDANSPNAATSSAPSQPAAPAPAFGIPGFTLK